ncbi:MAG TPA: BTAD domain-containing putative transcriptional regulator [Acidimicrobiales bacterium]|nr:BTAD domain-containing putative transcriptional regulator [Acidimicrobiales bacterium]
MIGYRLLGGLRVHDGEHDLELGGPKQRAVLAALLLELGRAVSPASLVERVWPDEAPERADASLQAYVSNLRRVLEPTRRPREAAQVLVTRPTGYALVVDRAAVDVARFEDLAVEGQKALRNGDQPGAAELLDRALATWTGPLLPEMAGWDWVDQAAGRLERLRAQVLEERFDAGLAMGEGAALVARIEEAVAADPYRERWRSQLAVALYRAGRQREALASLQDARRALADDVGIDPGPELRRIEAAILAHDPALDARAPVAVLPEPATDVVAPAPVFLFTDIEGSTRLWEADRVAMATALARHDEIVEATIADAGGSVFSRAGDAFAAVFRSAADAVDAAVAVQRALGAEAWPTGDPLRVRVGLHAGEAEERGGDFFGPAVNEASRVMSVGHGGQVLLTDAVVAACGDVDTRALGPVQLRGISEPLAVHQLVADGLATDFPPLRLDEPHEAPAEATRTLVGRDEELAEVLDAYAAAARRHGCPVVISGEPGIGKTRLVEELIARVPEAVVAWGRCPETGAQAAYLPCIQIARQLEGSVDFGDDLAAVLLPEVDVQHVDPSAERLAFHVGVARLLGAGWKPVVLVVDDLQWADPASLRLIEYVAAELSRTPVLLVVTVRPLAADAPVELVDCLGELARAPGAVRIDLGGLGADDVARWLDERSGGSADPAVAERVLDRTGGNPFFVGEVVELLAGDGRLGDPDAASSTAVPAAVQDVVRRRVGRLPGETQQLLAAASIHGRVFDTDVVGDVVSATGLEVLERLEPALDSGLVADGGRPGRFQFSHALVAETLASELNVVRRARLHATTADALVRLRAGDLDVHAAEVAHHAFEGAAAGSAELALEWAVRAAHHAAGRNAHEDAARHWERAVRALELVRPTDVGARVDALIEQGEAHMRADQVAATYRALISALELALDLGDHERIGRAAVSMTVEGLWMAGEDAESALAAVPVLERCVAALPDDPTPQRALALANLADNAYWMWPVERLDELSAAAVEVARATGDEAVLARTLQKRAQAMWRAGTRDAIAAAADELLEVAGHRGDELAATGLLATSFVSWEHGDIAEAERRVEAACAIAERLGNPALLSQLGFSRVALLTWRGRLAEAERVLEETHDLYRRTRRWASDAIRAGFLAVIRAEQGRIDEVLAESGPLLAPPYGPWFREAVIWALAEDGRLDEAAALVEGLPPLVDCWLYVGVLAAAAHSRAALGMREHVTVIRDHLRPHAGMLAATGTGSAFGDVDLALARCELALGDPGAARPHLDASIRLLESDGEGPWLARALLLRAELTGNSADRARAADIVHRLDLPLLARQL